MEESTAPPIARVVDGDVVSGAVMLTSPVRSSDNEQLEALRQLDQFRQWHSLEEKRYCLVCGNLITGWQIQIAGGTRGNGPPRLNCPTEQCNSIPMDWVLPTDEILARVEIMAAEQRKAAPSKPAGRINEEPERLYHERRGIASRLRKFAFNFNRGS